MLALFAILTVAGRAAAQAPTFNTVILTPTGSQPWQHPTPAAIGDFNNDGKLDAMIADSTAALRYLRGNGNGTFTRIDIGLAPITGANTVGLPASLLSHVPKAVDGYWNAKAADLNGDGRLDVVSVMGSHINWGPYNGITVALNTGNDANGVPQFSTVHNILPATDVRSFTAGDLNGDGGTDFIAGFAYGQLVVYRSNANGTITVSQGTGLSSPGAAVAGGAIADLNGDGKADFVVTTGQGSGTTDLFFGNGDGTLQAPVSIATDYGTVVALADVNNDGSRDVIRALGDGSVSVKLNNGNGTFGSGTFFSTVAGAGATGFFMSDVNGDGNLDAAMSLYSAGKVVIVMGNGDGTFGASYPYAGIPNARDVTLADFTNDGKVDIGSVSAASYGGQTFALLTNTTPFALPTQTLTLLGGLGNVGDPAANVEYFNPVTGNWQPAYLADYAAYGHPVTHPWGNITGTNHWINYKRDGGSDPGLPVTKWYLYRVRFTVPADAINPKMTFSLKADNYAQVAINGTSTGALIVGSTNQFNADAIFSQAVQTGENTITLNIGDAGGLNGFNFRIDLSMQSSEPLEVVPVDPDTTAPVITAPGDIVEEATSASGATVSFNATAADDVDGPVAVMATPASGSTFQIGNTTVNLSASDAAGNTATASFNVTVQDTIAPVVTAPASIVAEATSADGAAVSYPAATATDAVGVTSIVSNPPSGSTFPLGTTTVTATAKDAAGNAGGASFTVSVVDTTAPALTVPANQTLEATSAAGAVATFSASATDAVGVTSITYSKASGAMFSLGTTTVTVTATDAAGNSSQTTFTVIVRDTTAPAIASVTPSQGALWPPNHQMVGITLNAVATDAVGVTSTKIVSVTSSEPDNGLGDGDTAGDTVITGPMSVNLRAERAGKGSGRTYTITVEARDAAGNASTKTTTVFVPKSQGK